MVVPWGSRSSTLRKTYALAYRAAGPRCGADQFLELARGHLAIHQHIGRLHGRHREGFTPAARLPQRVGTEMPIPPRASAP